MNPTIKCVTKEVKLSELREGELAGRGKQATDNTIVYSYLECLRSGANFPPMKVTSDLVIFGGNHRHETFKLFYKDEDPLIKVDVYPGLTWDGASEAERQRIADYAFSDNWNPSAGKPLDFNGVKRNVRQHISLGRTDAQIFDALGATYGVKLLRRAINAERQADLQEKQNYARLLVKRGYSLKKAAAEANLPLDTNLETLKPGGKRDPKVRVQQITKASTSCGNKWQYQLDNVTDLFNARSITQEAFLSVVDAMDRASATLNRQAQRSRRLALETISESAKRLRHGV